MSQDDPFNIALRIVARWISADRSTTVHDVAKYGEEEIVKYIARTSSMTMPNSGITLPEYEKLHESTATAQLEMERLDTIREVFETAVCSALDEFDKSPAAIMLNDKDYDQARAIFEKRLWKFVEWLLAEVKK